MLAGRLWVPEVTSLSSLQEVLAATEHPVLLARGAPQMLARLATPRDVTLVVGPEGGWTDRELGLAAVTASLGPRNLRADTAALVGLSIALAARE
jgi:16S rRNA (uracil1498-N3)-methyltransferase